MNNKHIAICGLECSSCPMYVATQKDDDGMRKRVAKEWSERYRVKGYSRPELKPEDVNCDGCLSRSGRLYLYCRDCEVRKCALGKGVQNCGECKDYPCEKIVELHKRTTGGKVICDKIKAEARTRRGGSF